MRGSLFSLRSYLNYWLFQEDKYSQHSPFVFEIYSSLLDFLRQNPTGDTEIESIRNDFLKTTHQIEVLDLGAGSKKVRKPLRQIRKITKYSTSSAKYAQLYQFFCSKTPANHVIELGTCMGMSTRYLAKSTKGKLFTFEGSEKILEAAQNPPFSSHVKPILGPIEFNLPKILEEIPEIDFALIDATHTYEATVQYFSILMKKTHPMSILAVADIHWSRGMEKAWETIKGYPEVNLTMDFFECGIVFFSNPGPKNHLILQV